MSAPTSSFQFTVAFCRGEPVCSPAFASRRVRFSVRHSGACRNQGGRDIHWFWSTLRLPPASAGMTAMWPIAHNARGSTLPSPDSIRKTGRTRRSAPTGMRRTREQDCLNSMRRPSPLIDQPARLHVPHRVVDHARGHEFENRPYHHRSPHPIRQGRAEPFAL